MGDFLLVVVMTAALSDVELSVLNAVDQTVLLVDSAAEEALQISFQRFRLANALQWAVSVDIFDERVNALEGFLILRLPIQVVLPGFV